MFSRLWKPWFIHRPSQILRRAWYGLSPPRGGYRPLRTSWGASLQADPVRTIGRNIVNTGLYDISVSEALVRLVTPGAVVYDIGANIGHMTLLAATAAGLHGQVHAFEPLPDLAGLLRANVDANAQGLSYGSITVHQCALGATLGRAQLFLPQDFDGNDGLASFLLTASPHSVEVRVQTLDVVLGNATIDVLKIDVEGFEYQVFQGGACALAEHRIRHIVFEEGNPHDSRVFDQLRGHGYRVFSLGWTVRKLVLMPVEQGIANTRYETPNFLATVAPEEAVERCRRGGWQVLKRNLGR
jgi:FkbM family methyltransferase